MHKEYFRELTVLYIYSSLSETSQDLKRKFHFRANAIEALSRADPQVSSRYISHDTISMYHFHVPQQFQFSSVVDRFISSLDCVGVSASSCFYCTRSFMLGLCGILSTYVVVLIQSIN